MEESTPLLVLRRLPEALRVALQRVPPDEQEVLVRPLEAAPELVPPPLIEQLRPGGRLVIPAGLEDQQQLMLMEKDMTGRMSSTEIIPVVFSRLITAH